MRRLIFIVGAVSLAASACEREAPRRNAPLDAAPVMSTSTAGMFELVATESWDRDAPGPKLHAPDDAIPEEEYRVMSSPVRYEVAVRDGGNRIEVKGNGVQCSGARIGGNDKAIYALDDGLFAGGRFVIRTRGGARTGELTVYGSGVPVVSSQRGRLVDARTPAGGN